MALYRFLEDEAKWVRMDIEGASFITRNQDNHHSFIILNKIGRLPSYFPVIPLTPAPRADRVSLHQVIKIYSSMWSRTS